MLFEVSICVEKLVPPAALTSNIPLSGFETWSKVVGNLLIHLPALSVSLALKLSDDLSIHRSTLSVNFVSPPVSLSASLSVDLSVRVIPES